MDLLPNYKELEEEIVNKVIEELEGYFLTD